jgi:hypothetical protein
MLIPGRFREFARAVHVTHAFHQAKARVSPLQNAHFTKRKSAFRNLIMKIHIPDLKM